MNDLFYGVTEISADDFTIITKTTGETFKMDDQVFFLIEGTVANYYTYPDNLTINPYRMHYFDLIGVYEMFYPSQIQMTYKAATDVTMMGLDKDAFVSLTQDNHSFYERVLIQLINRESFMADHYMNLIQKNVDERLIKFVAFSVDIRYFDTHEIFTILDSHQMIADSLGVNIRSIHRALKKLVEEGLIFLVDGKIRINKIQYQKCESFS